MIMPAIGTQCAIITRVDTPVFVCWVIMVMDTIALVRILVLLIKQTNKQTNDNIQGSGVCFVDILVQNRF